jgi:protocatechuate 3,4-dioxygenase, alpha subunit
VSLPGTPSQTVGPFYSIGLCRRSENELVPEGIELRGTLYDGQGEPIPDGMIEIWDAASRAWGRCGTAEEAGGFRFRVPEDARVLEVFVFSRGMLRHERTRVYLCEGDDDVWNALDEVQRARLLARHEGDALVFDIRMQGEDATVFFEH